MPRHEAQVTHFCAPKLIHAKNTTWNRICCKAKTASDIIHTEGVRFAFPIIRARGA
jgi:hypothetical protein